MTSSFKSSGRDDEPDHGDDPAAADRFDFVDLAEPEPVALLLPAVQAAREAARSSDDEAEDSVTVDYGIVVFNQSFEPGPDILSDM